MALKTPQNKIKNAAIKKYENQDLSKHENGAENKNKSKLRRRKSLSQDLFYDLDFYAEINSNKILFRTSSPETTMAFYNPNVVYPSLPYTINQWDLYTPQIQSQVYTVPVPTVPLTLISPPLPILPAPGMVHLTPPHSDVLFTPTYSPVVPCAADNVCTALDRIYDPVSSFAALTPVTSIDEDCYELEEIEEVIHEKTESLEYYLSLPKDLFPKAKMLTLDPNPIIDEMCKIKDINKHTSWILDLEFGVPRTAVTRPVAVYDVQFNNIHCKNTPEAIHPGFEDCSEEFRQVFLFYYDCIVSVWYRSYIVLTRDDSVKNFQNWLVLPMQALGMCWS